MRGLALGSRLSRIAQKLPITAKHRNRNIDRNAKRHGSAMMPVPYSMNQPPRIGPIAAETPAVAPQMPKAIPRSLPLKVAETIESVEGDIIAAPKPCSTRLPMAMPIVADVPTPSDPNAKTTAPPMKILRRPNWSPSLPHVISSAPNTSE